MILTTSHLAVFCELVRQVALGLTQAHAAGIVHRDIKPSNLMLNQRGQVKILDFGLARLGPWSEHTTELTTVGQLMGTLDYMAPEQAEKAEAVDNRADLYSLGATLFRLLCGRAPLADSTDQSPLTKLRLLATREAPGLRNLRPDAPSELAQLVQEMLARNPLDRPASAAEIATRLEPLCRGHQLQETLSGALIISEKEKHPEPSDPLFLHNLSMQLATTERADNKSVPSQNELEHSPKNHSDSMESSAEFSPVTHQSTLATTSKIPSRWRWSNWVWGTVIGAVLTAGSYGGIILWLNSQEGWLHIESDVRVTVELVDEGNSTKEWKLQPGPNSTRLYAGQYRIELDKGSDGIQLDKDQLQVFKGGVVLAKIFKTPSGNAPPVELSNEADKLQGAESSPTGNDALLFKGRTLSEWMRVIPLEKDPEGIAQALAAISSATTDQTRPQIAAFLKRELPKLDWYNAKLQRQAFECLRSADDSHYFEYLRDQLQATNDQNWKGRILSESMPQNASFGDLQPLHQWFQENIFNQPGPYLETIANFFLRRSMIRYTNDGELSEESWMRPLIDCDHLSDLFWFKPTVENQAQQTFRAPERYWTEVVRQAIRTLGDSGADVKRLVTTTDYVLERLVRPPGKTR